ncbi:protein mono-ADP-ribosyltransferase PARP14-like [Engraulis encrasicolus]|uniref:protein mono-ADP-ribosyltransferase PARP14-like n=1 Tax=Engraulis encrasicolus TaxID=184585 RepID=UPI002FD0F599
MEYPYRAIVRGEWLPDHRKVIRQKLQKYFQSKKKSGGSDCDVVEYDDKSDTAVIGFKQEDVLERVLLRTTHEITIDNKQIKVFIEKESKVEETGTSSVDNQTPDEKASQPQLQDQQHEAISAATSASTQEERTEDQRTEDDYQPKAVVVENIADNMTRDLLGLIVENISGVGQEAYTMELIYDVCVAVVTFINSDDAKKFQAEAKRNKRFQDYSLSARFLERTCCLRIDDLPPHANEELLVLYCENKKVDVQNVYVMPEENAAIVTFQKPEDAEIMLSTRQQIGKFQVRLHPYYQSLGSSLCGKDRPKLKIPDSFSEALNPALVEFLLKKNLTSRINDQMLPHFCQVSIQDSTVILSPLPTLLKKKGITAKYIDDWKENTSVAFHQAMSKYATLEMAINVDVCGPVQKQLQPKFQDHVVIKMDSVKGQLTLAGMSKDIENLRPIVNNIVQKETGQLEFERNSITEQMDLPPTIFKLLQFDGLSQYISTSAPQISQSYQSKIKKLVLSGLKSEVLSVKNWILEKKLQMIERRVDLDRHIVEFLRGVDSEVMSEHLFLSRGIHAIYVIKDEAVFLTANMEKSIQESTQKMKETLAYKVLAVEDQEVLRKSEWKTLKAELLSMYNVSGQIPALTLNSNNPGSFNVAGFLEPVNEASLNLDEFLKNYARVEDTVKVRCCAAARFIEEHKSDEWKKFAKAGQVVVKFYPNRPRFRLSGERLYVKPAVDEFKKMATSLFTDELKVSKPGAKKYFQEQGQMLLSVMLRDHRVVVLLQDESMLEDVDDEEDERRDRKISSSGTCEVKMPCGVLIAVSKSDICKFQADAVVNAANEDLKHIGGLALALLNAAGQLLQSDCDRYTSKHRSLRPGESIITGGGRLPCKHVVHAVGPRFSDTDRKTAVHRLKRAIHSSLERASEAHCSSIAIPAISSGIFGFPLDLCANTIASAVREYFETGPGQTRTSLIKIFLVNNDDKTVNAMVHAVETVFRDMNPRSESSQQALPRKRVHSGSVGNQWEEHVGASGGQYRPPSEFNYNKYNHQESQWQGPSTRSSSKRGPSQPNRHGVLDSKQTPQGVRIVLKEGNIQDASTDVVVNTVAENVDLSQGAVSKALLQAAGQRLQSAANDLVRGGRVKPGEMVVTDGFGLKCKKVFHTVCPPWDQRGGTSEKILQKMVKDCLQEVDQQGLTSVTFPAIGTGNLGFPKDLVPRIMLEETETSCRKAHFQHLKEVVIIVHPSDKESVDCFKRAFRGENQKENKGQPHGINTRMGHGGPHKPKPQNPSGLWDKVQNVSLGKHTVRIGHLTLELSSGDITRETTDVIVNSSNSTFSLKSGVSMAILGAAGSAVEAECSEIVSSPNYQQTEMILTFPGNLLCKHILHIVGRNNPNDIKEGVQNVLTFCEKRRFSSVSFPALGTGQGGANASAVAEAMIEAVVSFVKKTKYQNIKLVKILIFQPNMLTVFHQSLMARQAKGGEDDKGLWDKIKGTVTGWFSSAGPEDVRPDDEEFVMVGEEFAPAIFQLCGQTSQDVSKAKDVITGLIMKEQFSTQVQDTLISRFTPEDSDLLQKLQREMTVSIRLDKTGSEPVIHLEGLTRDVVVVEKRISDMIRRVERKDRERKDAYMISTVIEWQFLDRSNNIVPFNMYDNMTLEQAFKEKRRRVNIKIGRHDYEVDLSSKIASRPGGSDIELIRVDRKDQSSVNLPSHWDDMKGKIVVQIPLPTTSSEYSEVEKEFRKTGLNSAIIQIERVQNSSLWKNYMIKKDEFDQKNKHTNNEKRLFHGTTANTIDKINNHGFNRSYAGSQVGAMYGKGSYFAVDPQYSASGYSKPDASGHKRMYWARVLVGDYTQGAGGMIGPPAKNTGNAADTYDSVTDNTTNPKMFVVFNDVQAYPEYIITFT